jgi:hypothetical protein
MRRQLRLARAVRLGALAGILLAGCDDPRGATGGSPSETPIPSDGLGSISVELHLGSTIRVSSVAYHITRTGFDRTGTLDVSSSTTVSGVVGGLPVATGYTLAMTASDLGGQLNGCQGSSTFNVTANAVTPVPIHLTCHEASMTTPPPPPSVPIPPVIPALLVVALLAIGLRKSVTRSP